MSLDNGYIKLWRSMLTWEWYDDPPTKDVYIHLILTANIKPSTWNGVDVPRGSLVSSYARIAAQTSLTVQQVRTAIAHLEATGEITRSPHPKFTVFTLNNFEKFQTSTSKSTINSLDNQQANPTKSTQKRLDNQQQNKNTYKKIKKEENISADAQKNQDAEGYVFIPDYPRGGNF